jgi:tellurite resistance protein TehA-like permease
LNSTESISQRASAAVAGLHPAYFALVMATGIISLASFLVGLRALALGLLPLNVAFYVALWALTVARVALHRDRVKADLLSHGRSVGFFTTVAATCVLGSQFLVVGGSFTVAAWFWALGLLLWASLTYSVFAIITVKSEKPSLAEGLNGGWLVAVVAAQSVVVLGAQLAPGLAPYQQQVLLFCLVVWLGGGMLYLWIISMIFYRYTFFVLTPSDLAPPYWINMGAAAISTLAGTMLIGAAAHSPVLGQVLPFLRGMTLMWWATATWWIPMLLILGVWRHVYWRFPLRYDPLYWGAVFPLGMYTACTARLSHAIEAPYLFAIPRVSIYFALAAWALALAGMIWRLGGLLRQPPASLPGGLLSLHPRSAADAFGPVRRPVHVGARCAASATRDDIGHRLSPGES